MSDTKSIASTGYYLQTYIGFDTLNDHQIGGCTIAL
jgi:hypothetical protein